MPHEDHASSANTPDTLSDEVRRQVLSGTRMKIAFVVVTLLMLAGLSAVMMVSVDRIFDWLTPVARKDLFWKAQRGVAELGRTMDLGILLQDRQLIAQNAKDYEGDPEVKLLAVLGAQGELLYEHKKGNVSRDALFEGGPRKVRESAALLASWTDVQVEGARIGKVGLAVSTERLRAGERLRQRILQVALAACLLASVLSLAFVQLYVGPLIAVTKRAFLQLEQKTLEALESTRVKSEFLANMSHEIRTPLNAVIGMLGLLLRDTLTSAQRRRAEISESSARSLLALISDVLDFSKMEAGQHALYPSDCDLRVLVQNRMELLAVKAHEKQLEIAYRIAPEVPAILRIDPDRLTQVLTNLVGNAIKFTDEGEVLLTVSVLPEARQTDGKAVLRFEVRDTGPGIDPSVHARLFKSFSQVDASATRSHEGTGLGLAISKHLVELMGGEIGLSSERGRGACFHFTLPCPVVQLLENPRRMAGSPHGRRVLVAYPNQTYRELLVDHAKNWGMLVSANETGEQALTAAKEAIASGRPFECAVVDLRLHDAQGTPIARALEQCCGKSLTIIQLTPALWTPPDNQNGHSAIFLAKPVRASELYNCIANGALERGGGQQRAHRLGQRCGHILVVDDNEVNRILAEELLRELGHSCDLASGGKEAVDQVSSRVYDAILMDCQMPGMNGYQATHEIRELERRTKRRTPIIALTAHAFTGEAQKVKAAGMDDFLTKPVTPQLLDSALQKWMATAATGRARSVPSAEVSADAVPVVLLAAANDGVEARGSAREQDVKARGSVGERDPAADQIMLEERSRSARLLEIFLRIVPEQVSALLEASAGDDLAEVRERAHKLKGSSLSIGAMRMSKLCEAMQQAAEENDARQLSRWGTRLADELRELRPRLEAELSAKRAQA